MIIGRDTVLSALERIGIGGNEAASVASSLMYMQLDPELALFAGRTETEILDFVDDCNMMGSPLVDPFAAIDKLKAHMCTVLTFFQEDEGQRRKIASGIRGLELACGVF